MSAKEIAELYMLKRKLFRGAMFVVMDEKDPDVIRYNELIGKYVEHRRFMKNSIAL